MQWPDFKKDIRGWIQGKVGYFYSCTRKLKLKKNLRKGRDNKDEDSTTELEASKG